MRKGIYGFCLTVTLVLTEMNAASAKDYGWIGSATLGAVLTSGNAETHNINAEIKERYQGKQWHHKLHTALLRNRSESKLNAERYLFDYQLLYKVLPQSDVFLDLRALHDTFSGFTRQYFVTTGYEHLVVETHDNQLSMGIGVGLSRQEKSNDTQIESTVFRSSLNFSHEFENGNQFNFDLLTLSGRSNTHSTGKVAIKAKLLGRLGTEVAITVSRNSNVPVDKVSTDTATTLGFVYDF